jgi:hypothetical protein
MLPYIRCPPRIRVDVQPCRVLIIRVRRSSQVGVGPFHEERVTESDGDWEWFGGEDGVCGGQSDVFVTSAFAVRVDFDTGNVRDRLRKV